MKLYREIPKDSTQTHLIEFSKFNKVARYKVNIQTSYFNILIMNYQKEINKIIPFVKFSSVTQSCLTLCNPINCSTPGLPVQYQLLEFTEIHVHWVDDAIQQSHPLLSPSHPTLNLSQHKGLCKWISSSHQVAKVLEYQLQHQSSLWIPRTDLL